MSAPIALDDILVPDDRSRQFDRNYALVLAEGLARDGLFHAIQVRRTPNGQRKFTLVSGLHRLEAARICGWQAIDARIVKADGGEALRLEIEENLRRYDLTALDRAHAVAELRRLWEAEHGSIDPKGGRPQKLDQVDPVPAGDAELGTFLASAADRIGFSEPAVKRLVMIAQRLQPELKAFLHGRAEADNQSALLKAAKVAPEWQKRALAKMQADPTLELGAAIDQTTPFGKTDIDPQVKYQHRAKDIFFKLQPARRRDLLVQLGVPEDIAAKIARRKPKADDARQDAGQA